MVKKPRERQLGLLHPIPPGRRPFEVIHADHVGSFVITLVRNKYILTFVDNPTKYICLFATIDTTTEGVLSILDKIICQFEFYPEQ